MTRSRCLGPRIAGARKITPHLKGQKKKKIDKRRAARATRVKNSYVM
jgi:hypothetical protein